MAKSGFNRSHENRFNKRFSGEPVYGEGIRTFHEEGRALVELKKELDSGNITLIGSSIVGTEVGPTVAAILSELHASESLGSSVFCGDGIEIVTQDGGILVIGDDCIIYNTKIKVAKGCVLMLENTTLLACDVLVDSGEHKIVDSNMSRCNIKNSTLNNIESKDSDIKTSLIRDAHFMNASLTKCIGSAGGSELGGIYVGKSISYFLQPEIGYIRVNIEDIKEPDTVMSS